MLSLFIESVDFSNSRISKLRFMNQDVIYVPNESVCVGPCAILFKIEGTSLITDNALLGLCSSKNFQTVEKSPLFDN